MANPTTNYGFVLPTTTDLVTDLPADFDVALQGVDTRLKALQPGTTSGDLAYSSATANTNVRLPIGSTNQVLSVVAGVPAWATTADVTPLTTKGDLFTFTTVDARIGVGANNTVLTADSAEASGLKWAAPAGASALTLIQRSSFSNVAGTSSTFDGVFTSTYRSFLVIIEQISAATEADDLHLQFRYSGSTQVLAYFSSSIISPSNTTVSNSNIFNSTQILLASETGGAGYPSGATLYFNNIGNGSSKPNLYGQMMSAAGTPTYFNFGGYQDTARSYNGFLLKSSSSNITGTVSVYGLAIA